MIANSIDGSTLNGASQFLDFLDLVSNKDVYAQKVKDLQDAIAKNQQYVELVAPASDILTLRDQAAEDRKLAKQELDSAKAQSAQAIKEAKGQAKQLVADANEKAAKILLDASSIKNEASSALNDLNSQIALSKKSQDAADKASTELAAQLAILDEEKKAAIQAIADAETMKEFIAKKHQEFLESLG